MFTTTYRVILLLPHLKLTILPKRCYDITQNGSWRITVHSVETDGNELVPLPSGRKNKNHCLSAAGVSYSSGDTWRVNGCQSCVCQNGQIHCFSQSCPLLTCNETQLKKGQCCPHCAGMRTKKNFRWDLY